MFHTVYSPSGYYCTSTLQLSVANQELLPQEEGREYRGVSLYNVDALTITFIGVNEMSYTQYLPAGVGFNIDPNYLGITSLKIAESGKTFILTAAY